MHIHSSISRYLANIISQFLSQNAYLYSNIDRQQFQSFLNLQDSKTHKAEKLARLQRSHDAKAHKAPKSARL